MFFHLGRRLRDLNIERTIEVQGCTTQTSLNLEQLFPRTEPAYSKKFEVLPKSSSANHDESLSPFSPACSEDFGPFIIDRSKRGWGKLTRTWAFHLVDRTVEKQSLLKNMRVSLACYYLWRSFEWSCDDIEALLPRRDFNLPSSILEVIEVGRLPVDEERYARLQEMAYVQFVSTAKIPDIESHTANSTLQALSTKDWYNRQQRLMSLIRMKLEAETWSTALPRRDRARMNRRAKDLVPYGIWQTGRASVEEIGRLLRQPKSVIAASILGGARWLGRARMGPRDELEGVAKLTDNPPFWHDIIRDLYEGDAGRDVRPLKAAKDKVAGVPKRGQEGGISPTRKTSNSEQGNSIRAAPVRIPVGRDTYPGTIARSQTSNTTTVDVVRKRLDTESPRTKDPTKGFPINNLKPRTPARQQAPRKTSTQLSSTTQPKMLRRKTAGEPHIRKCTSNQIVRKTLSDDRYPAAAQRARPPHTEQNPDMADSRWKVHSTPSRAQTARSREKKPSVAEKIELARSEKTSSRERNAKSATVSKTNVVTPQQDARTTEELPIRRTSDPVMTTSWRERLRSLQRRLNGGSNVDRS
jgi:hypothetical protein